MAAVTAPDERGGARLMQGTEHLRAVAPRAIRPDWTPASTGVALLTRMLRASPRKILGHGACYLIYGVKRLWIRDHIVVTPDRPHRDYFLWKMAMLSGYRMIGVAAASRSPSRRPALAHFLHSDVTREGLHDPRLVNGACNDISKTHVDRVFRRVFGYSIMLDPTRHRGVAVRKSDENATHDGEIVQCPIAPDEVQPTMVYQKLIDNSVGRDLVQELRVAVIGADVTDVVIKQRAIGSRFLGFGDSQGKTLESVDAVFTAEEVAKIRQFNREIGLEFGELDILRDNSESRIYIIDANKTASFLCGPRSFRFDRMMLAWHRARHFRRFLRQRAEGQNGSIPADHRRP
jgi:hypothetical protein